MFADAKKGYGLSFRNHCVERRRRSRVCWAPSGDTTGVENLFLSGLLHDISEKLLAMQVGEIRYEALEPSALDSADLVHVHERAFAGYDHAVLGAPRPRALESARRGVEGRRPASPSRRKTFAIGGSVPGLGVALLRLADDIEFSGRRSRELDEGYVEHLAPRRRGRIHAIFQRRAPRHVAQEFVAARDEAIARLGLIQASSSRGRGRQRLESAQALARLRRNTASSS